MPFEIRIHIRNILVRRVNEKSSDTINFCLRQRRRTIFEIRPLSFDFGRKAGEPQFLDQNLDARLVHIVAATETVIYAEYCLEVGKEVLAWQIFANNVTENWRAPQPAANENTEANFTGFTFLIAHRVDADVMKQRTGTVFHCTVNRDLEFARQICKLRVER